MKNITIAGGIGKDAVTRTLNDGKKVTSWSVGVKDGWGQNEKTLWFDCSWWGARGEGLAQHLTKGSKVTISGDLSTREYEGKTYLTVNVSEVTLQGGGQAQANNGAQQGGYNQGQQNNGYGAGGQPGNNGGGFDIDSDSIPFLAEWRI